MAYPECAEQLMNFVTKKNPKQNSSKHTLILMSSSTATSTLNSPSLGELHHPIDREHVKHLLTWLSGAPSKQFVEQIFFRVHQLRLDGIVDSFVQSVVQEMSDNDGTPSREDIQHAHRALMTVQHLIHRCVFHSAQSEQHVFELVFRGISAKSEDLQRLIKLICQIVLKHGEHWNAQAVESQISLPKLVDMKWRVDLKTASQSMQRMQAPVVMVQLNTQHPPRHRDRLERPETVTFEMNHETLSIMLQGMQRIREQLGSIK